CTIRVLATSGADQIAQTFTVTVTNTNDLPTWSSTIASFNQAEDAALTGKTAVATDVDAGSSITYSLDTANMTCDDGSWSPAIAIDSSTGVLSGTPTNADVGSCTVRILAT